MSAGEEELTDSGYFCFKSVRNGSRRRLQRTYSILVMSAGEEILTDCGYYCFEVSDSEAKKVYSGYTLIPCESRGRIFPEEKNRAGYVEKNAPQVELFKVWGIFQR